MKINDEINAGGFSLIHDVIDLSQRQEFVDLLGPVEGGAGRRGLLALPEVAHLARSQQIMDLVRPHFSSEPKPVRAIYFDKSSEANWLVPWHQDLTLALRAKAKVADFGPWSIKDGIPHVQPPVAFLEEMLTVRIHLDETDESNGALRVLPGTHCLGRLSAERIQELRTQLTEVICEAPASSVMLMRPLLLHASSRSTSSRHRRILHIEYAGFSLPPPLQWHEGA